MSMRNCIAVALFAGLWMSSCKTPDEDADPCEGASPQGVHVKIVNVAIDEEVAKVRGTARHDDGLAIRTLLIDGYPAEPDSFNFRTWHADLPSLRFPDMHEVDVEATERCGIVELSATYELRDMVDAGDQDRDR
jgi:hypothetical protein